MEMSDIVNMEDKEMVFACLPENWEEKAQQLGALERKRKFDSAKTLFEVLMLHIGQGLSLRSTSALASDNQLVDVSDVAILKKLKQASPWFQWITRNMVDQCQPPAANISYPKSVNIKYADGSRVEEEGKTGSSWRVHYLVGASGFSCEEVLVTGTDVGESFSTFDVSSGDVLVGDRGYCRAKGIRSVVDDGGDVIVRLHHNAVKICDKEGDKFNLKDRLTKLQKGNIGDWYAGIICADGEVVDGRICAIKKSQKAKEQAVKKCRKCAQKHGYEPSDLTLTVAGYVVIFTTTTADVLSSTDVLEIYQGRWQIELSFKRLKTLLQMGQLPKKDPDSARAWLQGKIMLSFIVEYLIRIGESFFPWGYPLFKNEES